MTFLVKILSLSFSSLGRAGVVGDKRSSLPSKIPFKAGFKGFPTTLSILRVLMSPRPSGRVSILLCWIANTRRAFILSISSGTSLTLFLLRSRISSWGRPKTYYLNQPLSCAAYLEFELTAFGIHSNRLSRRLRYFNVEQLVNSIGISRSLLWASCSLWRRIRLMGIAISPWRLCAVDEGNLLTFQYLV